MDVVFVEGFFGSGAAEAGAEAGAGTEAEAETPLRILTRVVITGFAEGSVELPEESLTNLYTLYMSLSEASKRGETSLGL